MAFDYEDFWAHSLATAIACQQLAAFAQVSGELFTIGLLARIGELALASIFPQDYSELLIAAREHKLDLTPIEQERFGLGSRTSTSPPACSPGGACPRC